MWTRNEGKKKKNTYLTLLNHGMPRTFPKVVFWQLYAGFVILSMTLLVFGGCEGGGAHQIFHLHLIHYTLNSAAYLGRLTMFWQQTHPERFFPFSLVIFPYSHFKFLKKFLSCFLYFEYSLIKCNIYVCVQNYCYQKTWHLLLLCQRFYLSK